MGAAFAFRPSGVKSSLFGHLNGTQHCMLFSLALVLSLSRVSIGVFPRISVRAQTHRQAVRLAGRRTDRQTKRLSPPAPLARPRRRPLRSNTTRRGAPLHASTEAELACVFVRPAAASVSTVRWCHCSSATCTNCMETKYHHHHHHPVVVSVM